MSDPDRLKSLLRQAELYRTQGLLKESKRIYLDALKFLQEARRFKNQDELEETVKSRIKLVDKDQEEFDQATDTPELSKDLHALIKKSFAFSQTTEAAAMEGALALAKFGQYEAAMAEFEELLKKGKLAVPAAKNIMRCHIASSGPEAAITQFKKWMSREEFLTTEELRYLRGFVTELLKKNGVEIQLPELPEEGPGTEEAEEVEEETIDISAVSFQIQRGPLEGKTMEFNVAFQLGNVVSVIVSGKQKALLQTLRPDSRLPDIQCYSPITVFRCDGKISGRSKIQEGPRKGDFMVDISIEEI